MMSLSHANATPVGTANFRHPTRSDFVIIQKVAFFNQRILYSSRV